MNDTSLEIVIEAKDEASATFKSVSGAMAETSRQAKAASDSFKLTGDSVGTMTRLIEGAAVAAAGTAIAFGVSSVHAFEQAQVAMAKVDAMLKTMGKSAIDNRDKIVAAADAAVRLGFDDEDAAVSITKLYQRTGNLTTAIKLNNIAMDLARAKNLDLGSAMNLVNLVLSGQGRLLAQYGIHIKDAATPLEALGELQMAVAGQADAFSQTFQGQMEVLGVQFENIKEVIGGALVGALIPFIQEFTTWLNDPKMKENIAYYTVQFQSWAEVIIPVLVDTFKMWVGWAQKLYDLITGIADKFSQMNADARAVGAAMNTGNILSNFVAGVRIAANGGQVPARAGGGPVSAGVPYLVGERGPEMFMPATSGTIIPNGGGTSSIIINMNGALYGTDRSAAESFANQIARILGQQLKIRTI